MARKIAGEKGKQFRNEGLTESVPVCQNCARFRKRGDAMGKDRNIFEDDEERGLRNLWRQIDRPESGRQAGGRRVSALTVGALVLAAAILSAVVWYSYPQGGVPEDALSAPVIRADAAPARVAPEEPGGMEIADRESTVFDAMRGAVPEEGPAVENLLAAGDDSEPVSRERLFAGLNTEPQEQKNAAPPPQQEPLLTVRGPESPRSASPAAVAEAEKSGRIVIKAAETASAAEVAEDEVEEKMAGKAEDLARTEPASGVSAPAGFIEKADSEKETKPIKPPEKKSSKPAKPASSKAGKPSPGSYYIQIASVPTRGGASREWTVLKAKYTDLKPLDMRVQEADLGAKGTFYRIQAGPMSKADASRICNAIKARKPGGCLVVGP